MTLRFAFDYISPFAYLAWKAIPAIAVRHGLEIEPFPVLFGAMLAHHGQLGPAEVPAKRTYMLAHAARSARELGVPIGLPPCHPFNPLLALRVTCLPMHPHTRFSLTDALFDEVWGRGERGITDPGLVGEICASLGVDEAVARAADPSIKSAVRDNTSWAIEHGAFGVPTVWADERMFWGFDALAHLSSHLEGAPPVDPSLVERWESIPQAHRKR